MLKPVCTLVLVPISSTGARLLILGNPGLAACCHHISGMMACAAARDGARAAATDRWLVLRAREM